eukprot:TRINITY_DN10869_c0_g1_i2.p1 TRINITY_DN10869_c0_g1~~TRINITY_DN10869_c0_g1_i2.p1  ORF type:complete len:466 (-),score=60.68 TRINITY_DN10869_c0_g1_i2:42-1379(-)
MCIRDSCCSVLFYEKSNKDHVVFHYGSFGDTFYIILKGSVSVFVPISPEEQKTSVKTKFQTNNCENVDKDAGLRLDSMKEIDVIREGGSFGELALISDRRSSRSATVVCREDCHFALISRQSFMELLGNEKKKEIENKIAFLRKTNFLRHWPSASLKSIQYYFKEKTYSINSKVYEKGDKPNGAYLIKSGCFSIRGWIPVIGTDGQRKRKTQLKLVYLYEGDMFGVEDILAHRSERETSVQCDSSHGEVFYITKEDLVNRILTNELSSSILKQVIDFRQDLLKSTTGFIKEKLITQNGGFWPKLQINKDPIERKSQADRLKAIVKSKERIFSRLVQNQKGGKGVRGLGISIDEGVRKLDSKSLENSERDLRLTKIGTHLKERVTRSVFNSRRSSFVSINSSFNIHTENEEGHSTSNNTRTYYSSFAFRPTTRQLAKRHRSTDVSL